MVDKMLVAARKLAASHRASRVSLDALELLDTEYAETFRGLIRVAEDYFNPGRSPACCKYCRAPIVWHKTAAGANIPLDAAIIVGIDPEGAQRRIRLAHHATCPNFPAKS